MSHSLRNKAPQAAFSNPQASRMASRAALVCHAGTTLDCGRGHALGRLCAHHRSPGNGVRLGRMGHRLEVLRMDGVVLPAPASGRVPLLDAHERGSVANALGCFVAFSINVGESGLPQIACCAFFSTVLEAGNAWIKVKEGVRALSNPPLTW